MEDKTGQVKSHPKIVYLLSESQDQLVRVEMPSAKGESDQSSSDLQIDCYEKQGETWMLCSQEKMKNGDFSGYTLRDGNVFSRFEDFFTLNSNFKNYIEDYIKPQIKDGKEKTLQGEEAPTPLNTIEKTHSKCIKKRQAYILCALFENQEKLDAFFEKELTETKIKAQVNTFAQDMSGKKTEKGKSDDSPLKLRLEEIGKSEVFKESTHLANLGSSDALTKVFISALTSYKEDKSKEDSSLKTLVQERFDEIIEEKAKKIVSFLKRAAKNKAGLPKSDVKDGDLLLEYKTVLDAQKGKKETETQQKLIEKVQEFKDKIEEEDTLSKVEVGINLLKEEEMKVGDLTAFGALFLKKFKELIDTLHSKNKKDSGIDIPLEPVELESHDAFTKALKGLEDACDDVINPPNQAQDAENVTNGEDLADILKALSDALSRASDLLGKLLENDKPGAPKAEWVKKIKEKTDGLKDKLKAKAEKQGQDVGKFKETLSKLEEVGDKLDKLQPKEAVAQQTNGDKGQPVLGKIESSSELSKSCKAFLDKLKEPPESEAVKKQADELLKDIKQAREEGSVKKLPKSEKMVIKKAELKIRGLNKKRKKQDKKFAEDLKKRRDAAKLKQNNTNKAEQGNDPSSNPQPKHDEPVSQIEKKNNDDGQARPKLESSPKGDDAGGDGTDGTGSNTPSSVAVAGGTINKQNTTNNEGDTSNTTILSGNRQPNTNGVQSKEGGGSDSSTKDKQQPKPEESKNADGVPFGTDAQSDSGGQPEFKSQDPKDNSSKRDALIGNEKKPSPQKVILNPAAERQELTSSKVPVQPKQPFSITDLNPHHSKSTDGSSGRKATRHQRNNPKRSNTPDVDLFPQGTTDAKLGDGSSDRSVEGLDFLNHKNGPPTNQDRWNEFCKALGVKNPEYQGGEGQSATSLTFTIAVDKKDVKVQIFRGTKMRVWTEGLSDAQVKTVFSKLNRVVYGVYKQDANNGDHYMADPSQYPPLVITRRGPLSQPTKQLVENTLKSEHATYRQEAKKRQGNKWGDAPFCEKGKSNGKQENVPKKEDEVRVSYSHSP